VVIGFMDEQSIGLYEAGYAHTVFCSCQLGSPFRLCRSSSSRWRRRPLTDVVERRAALSPMRNPDHKDYVCLVIGQVDTWDGQAQSVTVEAKPERHL
jgi:hypothetical protein